MIRPVFNILADFERGVICFDYPFGSRFRVDFFSFKGNFCYGVCEGHCFDFDFSSRICHFDFERYCMTDFHSGVSSSLLFYSKIHRIHKHVPLSFVDDFCSALPF